MAIEQLNDLTTRTLVSQIRERQGWVRSIQANPDLSGIWGSICHTVFPHRGVGGSKADTLMRNQPTVTIDIPSAVRQFEQALRDSDPQFLEEILYNLSVPRQ